MGTSFNHLKTSAVVSAWYLFFSFCVDPATTYPSPHEAASLAGCELVESSAVGTAGKKSLSPCQEFPPDHAAENNAFDSL